MIVYFFILFLIILYVITACVSGRALVFCIKSLRFWRAKLLKNFDIRQLFFMKMPFLGLIWWVLLIT